MDILFLIKEEHGRLADLMLRLEGYLQQSDIAQAERAQVAAFLDSLRVYLDLDRELIYPELGALVSRTHKVIAGAAVEHGKMMQLLADIEAAGATADEQAVNQARFAALLAAARAYLNFQQEQVIPRLREKLPTQEREDLGQVYLDMKDDLGRSMADRQRPQVMREQVG